MGGDGRVENNDWSQLVLALQNLRARAWVAMGTRAWVAMGHMAWVGFPSPSQWGVRNVGARAFHPR